MTNKREDREALIEEAAKAIEKVPHHAWHDVTREGAREIARVALAVFEQSHTPCEALPNDERETAEVKTSTTNDITTPLPADVDGRDQQ